MFSNNVLGIFSQIPILLYTKVASYTINYDAHTVLFINSETLVTNSPNNSAILDSSNNNFTITNTGSVTQGSFNPFDPFEKSAYFTGNNSNISLISNAFAFGTGDFTMEGWFYSLETGSSLRSIFDTRTTGTVDPNGILFRENSNGFLVSVGSAIITTTTGRIANTWQHLAVVRSGTTLSVYVNGILNGSTTNSTNYTGTNFFIGKFIDTGADPYGYKGYITDVRVTKGQALYTSNFTPPTTALSLTANGGAINTTAPSASNVSLLTLQKDSLFTDKSTNNFSLTSTGVGGYPLYPFASSSITYSSSAHGGSLYFNGSSYILVPPSNNFSLSGDFAIECWINTTETTNDYYTRHIMSLGTGSDASNLLKIFIDSNIIKIYNTSVLITGTKKINDGIWHHLALTRSGTSLKLFIDGVQDGSTVTNSTNFNAAETTNLRIGVTNVNTAAGANQGRYLGYLTDLRVTKGQALYTTNFTPPTALLSLTANGGATPSVAPSASNVSLLLKGTNAEILDAVCKSNISVGGSTRLELNSPTDESIADQSTNNFSLTLNNINDINTNSVYAVSGFSGYFNGSNTGLNLPISNKFDLTGDFTVECWCYKLTNPTYPMFLEINNHGTGAATGVGFFIGQDISAPAVFAGAWYRPAGAKTIPLNKWTHVAFVRQSNNLNVFVDGVSGTGTVSFTNSITATNNVSIGYSPTYPDASYRVNGYITDVRVTKGQVLYTSNFTPPTSPLSLTANGGATPSVAPTSSNVSLLTLQTQDKTFKDNSSNNFSLTSTNAGLLNFNPFYSNTNILTYGGSFYFNGSNAKLNLPISNKFDLTGDFTVECWCYKLTNPSYPTLLEINNHGGNNGVAFFIGEGTSAPSVYSTPGGFSRPAGAKTIPLNKWTHVAFVRQSNNLNVFVDGVSGTGTVSFTNSINATSNVSIGYSIYAPDNITYMVNGYLSDVRITKGQALYTSNFTPPTASLSLTTNGGATPSVAPTSSNVSLLLNNFIPSLTSNNRSIKFPQNGFLQVPNTNDVLTIGSSDYTIEFNLFNPIRGVQQTIIDQRIDATTQARLLVTIDASNKLVVNINGSIITSTNVVPYKKWTKYSIFRTSGALGLAVNDVVDADTVVVETTTYLAPTNGTRIGTDFASSSALSGYIDDFKVIKGVSKFQGYSSTTARALTFDYLVVAGGGGGGSYPTDSSTSTAGAGAGGYLAANNISTISNYTYTIVVGGGGLGQNGATNGNNGDNSSLTLPSTTITSFGGGGGSGFNTAGVNGGSGSGGTNMGKAGGSGTPGQGNNGANGANNTGGGGGGAGATTTTINGGNGSQWLDGNYYAGGGGGVNGNTAAGTGGAGGGANGTTNNMVGGNAGVANTGGGAGGARGNSSSADNNKRIRPNGGSGVVILRTAENSRVATTTGSPVITVSGGYRYYKFTGTGTFKP